MVRVVDWIALMAPWRRESSTHVNAGLWRQLIADWVLDSDAS